MSGPVLVLSGIVFVTAALNLALRDAGYATTLRYARMAVEHEATADSWRPMLRALDAWDHSQPIYETVFFSDRVKFQYPLTTLFLPMMVRSQARTGNDNDVIKTINRVSLAATVVCVACIVSLFVATWFSPSPDWSRWPVWVGVCTATVAAILFHPVLMSYVLGQIQSFVNAALAAMLLAWRLNKRVVAGVALGVACLLKPHLALILLWGLLRRAWTFAGAATIMIVIGFSAALAVFGVRDNIDYVRVVSYMAARGEAFAANQSVNGLLNRLVQPPDERQWDFHSFPPPHPVVRAGTLAAAVGLVGAALILPVFLGFSATAMDLAIIALSVTMASPIAWEHHYGILLPSLVLTAALALRMPAGRRLWLVMLGIAFVLAGSLWEPLLFVENPPANLVQSYTLAAGAIALLVMYRLGPMAARAVSLAGE